MDDYNQDRPGPPLDETYKDLFLKHSLTPILADALATEEVLEFPLVDLGRLAEDQEDDEWQRCKREIAEASKEWGFFQMVNHGIPQEILEEMRREQVKVFREPFYKKNLGRQVHELEPLSWKLPLEDTHVQPHALSSCVGLRLSKFP